MKPEMKAAVVIAIAWAVVLVGVLIGMGFEPKVADPLPSWHCPVGMVYAPRLGVCLVGADPTWR